MPRPSVDSPGQKRKRAWALGCSFTNIYMSVVSRIFQCPPILVVALCAAVLWGLSELARVQVRLSLDRVEAHDKFEASGPVPNGSLGPAGLKYWSSWAGNDAHHGALVLGPFASPLALTIQIIGYPQMGGNRLYFENVATGELFDPKIANAGEEWRRVRIDLPAAWHGVPTLLHAIDDADAWGGWLAVSEPMQSPWWAAWWSGIWPKLDATLFSGLAAALLMTASAVLLSRWEIFRGPGALFLAGAVTAAIGYLVFWIYFAHAATGRAAVGVIFGSAAIVSLLSHRKQSSGLWRDRDWLVPIFLATATIVFYVGLLFLFSADRPISDLAANRYRENLPADNFIPQLFADRLRAGKSLQPFLGDWLSSDRPPLQTGWILLLAPAPRLLGTTFADSDQIVSFWFQLLWIPAVWWWLRSLGVRVRHAAWIVAAIVPSGFFIIHSVYVWPKLGAGALALGAFTAWFVARGRENAPGTHFSLGGGMAALGWLAHGGATFSILAAAPLALVCWRQPRWRNWLGAGAVFLMLALPWIAYQKFYDPPGNRLLKWHLGGVIPPDERGTLETLAKSYRETPWSEWWKNRVGNVSMLFRGSWRQLVTFDTSTAQKRRDDEFFHTFFALGWWNVGFLALGALAIPRLRRRCSVDELRLLGCSAAWVITTLLVWVALMFMGWSTAIHQGSYAALLLLFPLLALALWRILPVVFGAVAATQLVTFPGIWMSAPPAMSALTLRVDAAAAVAASLASLFLIVAWSERRAVAPSAPASP